MKNFALKAFDMARKFFKEAPSFNTDIPSISLLQKISRAGIAGLTVLNDALDRLIPTQSEKFEPIPIKRESSTPNPRRPGF